MDFRAVSKAIAGFIAGAIVVWLTKHNVIIEDGLRDSLEIVLGALITGLTVYFAPRNEPSNRV